MRTSTALVLLATAWSILAPAQAWSQDDPQVTTVASYPGPAFLENLSVGPDGTLLFTSYLDRSLLAWSGSGAPTVLATLDVHPVGILSREDDIVVPAHDTSFAEGPGFTVTNAMLVLGRDGAILSRVAVPDALFLNGLVELAPDVVLVADSLAERIWRFDPTDGTIETWLADPLLAVAQDAQDQRPAANGLKVHDGWLYVSNSSRGAIHRVRLDGTAPSGVIETFAAAGPVDDFAVLPDGTVSDIMGEGCDGCTSVAPFGSDGRLVVLTTGNLLEGGTEPARVLSVTVAE